MDTSGDTRLDQSIVLVLKCCQIADDDRSSPPVPFSKFLLQHKGAVERLTSSQNQSGESKTRISYLPPIVRKAFALL